MRYPHAGKVSAQRGFAGRFKVKPGQTLSIELPPISGYSPFPESYWLIIVAIVAVAALAVATMR
jgi:hypothetical protein